jgi:hypothetical protein
VTRRGAIIARKLRGYVLVSPARADRNSAGGAVNPTMLHFSGNLYQKSMIVSDMTDL